MTSPRQGSSESHGPIPAFDHQLKTLSDSYIAFMAERVRIEEAYVEALFRLHRNIRALDNLLDDRDPSSIRLAWRELRDNVEREAETRTAFANTLKADVLPPLHAMRETQERTRKRIKEDLKESTLAHLEYAENTLPRLKRNYLKKCQEVEDYKVADRTTASSTPAPPPVMGTSPPSPPRSSMGDREKTPLTTVVSPTPSHPSIAPSTSRNRSPSTGTALSDLAHQGKKGLNQLMGFLDQNRERGLPGGSLKEGSERGNNGLRSVRAKREADEADKEYRKGVHWLETLRLRRVKILQAGYNSLEIFVSESGEVMKKALEAYVDCVASTTSTCQSLSAHAQGALTKISTKTDLDRVHQFVEYAFTRAVPPQTFYWNYQVGECRDLIFGVSLVDYATARNMVNEPPPLVVKCIREVEARGLDAEGIYRVSGRHAVVQELTHRIERNERAFEFNTEDVYAVSGLLKLYLRELPDPVFRFPLAERLQHTEDRDEHKTNGFLLLKSKIRRLPPVHQATLRALVLHLAHVASNASLNKMDERNLAIVFGAVIFGEDEVPKGTDVLSITSWKDTVMEDLILYAGLLFDDVQSVAKGTTVVSSSTNESPLPVVPAESPLGVEFGSSFTRITTLPPRNSANSKEEDFTPPLPARPQHSIHPSRRANSSRDERGLLAAARIQLARANEEADEDVDHASIYQTLKSSEPSPARAQTPASATTESSEPEPEPISSPSSPLSPAKPLKPLDE